MYNLVALSYVGYAIWTLNNCNLHGHFLHFLESMGLTCAFLLITQNDWRRILTFWLWLLIKSYVDSCFKNFSFFRVFSIRNNPQQKDVATYRGCKIYFFYTQEEPRESGKLVKVIMKLPVFPRENTYWIHRKLYNKETEIRSFVRETPICWIIKLSQYFFDFCW